jgi:hypothetical protein
LNVLVYTGYRLEALRAQPARFGSLLERAEFVIDGEYRREQAGPLRWRGSANQRLHVLSRGQSHPYEDAAVVAMDERIQEVQVSLSGSALRLTGFPDLAMERELAQRLAGRGVVMKKSGAMLVAEDDQR